MRLDGRLLEEIVMPLKYFAGAPFFGVVVQERMLRCLPGIFRSNSIWAHFVRKAKDLYKCGRHSEAVNGRGGRWLLLGILRYGNCSVCIRTGQIVGATLNR